MYNVNFQTKVGLVKMKINHNLFQAAIVLFILCCVKPCPALTQSEPLNQSYKNLPDSLQTIGQYVRKHLAGMTPPALKVQQQQRRTFQQRGYCNILLDVLNQDVLSALFSLLRVNLHIDYAVPHRVFWIIPPEEALGIVIPGIPFPDDWSFPEDPWSGEMQVDFLSEKMTP